MVTLLLTSYSNIVVVYDGSDNRPKAFPFSSKGNFLGHEMQLRMQAKVRVVLEVDDGYVFTLRYDTAMRM